ncbi:phage holin family protein [Limosilactobacillus reuteri]|uniref:phage holin, LLH family n=1 Tax=Limosilactobacillus reuteri TaxID=1598 RepID=UPI001E3B4AAB|nr:phage holin, LLH family [Limosilactobacillus reuteri]MCC4328150.1 phage holin family protein [Limosilactobacillus reuteri]MCC4336416.1 phage holin family protein [Limosilactobacillus reuteri]MCC4338190.1 phage holin family protein [Limosilactobacillus reuteri]
MTKLITDVGNWLISSGALTALVIFAWKYLKPVMIEKQKHAKTVQERELLDVTVKLADQAVTSLVGNDKLSGSDKFKVATSFVANSLADKGFKVEDTVVNHAVQAAYEKSDLTPTVDPTNEPQTGVVISND